MCVAKKKALVHTVAQEFFFEWLRTSLWHQSYQWIPWIWLTEEERKWTWRGGISLCLYSVVYNAVSQPFLLKQNAKKCRLAMWPVQFSSVTQSCPTVCDPMDCSTPGFPVHYQLLELTQTHDHRFSDAIQPSHPLSSPSPPTLNLSQHQGLFQWARFLHQVAKVLEFQLQHQSFQWIFRTDLL